MSHMPHSSVLYTSRGEIPKMVLANKGEGNFGPGPNHESYDQQQHRQAFNGMETPCSLETKVKMRSLWSVFNLSALSMLLWSPPEGPLYTKKHVVVQDPLVRIQYKVGGRALETKETGSSWKLKGNFLLWRS